ncbi:MAG: hypothetical protein M9914_04175 [Trueperaceae bacterium]|nr:hypothetical protein [Trueperaceae bacterium]
MTAVLLLANCLSKALTAERERAVLAWGTPNSAGGMAISPPTYSHVK